MTGTALLPKVAAWFEASRWVESVVLFGSSARTAPEDGGWSDLDFHVVATDARALERVVWREILDDEDCRLQVARPATGGVRKVTIIFAREQMDLVIVPAKMLRFAILAQRLGWDRRLRIIEVALNEMATCLHTGYRFIKGEERWGPAYARIAERKGVRLSDAEVRALANVFLCDLLWVLQKIERGELIAAQHALHIKLSETNLRFWREARFRRGQPLPSFGLGRRIETLATPAERARLEIEAPLESAPLAAAAWRAFEALRELTEELVRGWTPAPGMLDLLARSRSRLRVE